MRTEARSSGVSSSTSVHDIFPSAHCAAGSEMTPPSRGVLGVKGRAVDDMLTHARVGGTARSAAAHDERVTRRDTLIFSRKSSPQDGASQELMDTVLDRCDR